MDWNNVDLNDGYERDQNILDPYSFNTLLLEINCNLPKIDAETVKKEFEQQLQSKIDCARDVFERNLDNIVNNALEYRNKE